MNDAPIRSSAPRFVGERVLRKEDGRLLTGKGAFVDDVSLPGMVVAAFVRSPIARGRIRSIDMETALDVPGVRGIYTAKDLLRYPAECTSSFNSLNGPSPVVRPLADGDVRYAGDPVAMVLADNRYIAEDAAALVEIEYEEEQPVVTIAQALAGKPVHSGLPDNIAGTVSSDDDTIDAVFADAAHVVTGTIVHQRQAHASMETRGILATRNGPDNVLIHIACQSPHRIAAQLQNAFQLPGMHFHVISNDTGGSFGLKANCWREEIAVVAAALIIGCPVKWTEDRLENLTSACQAREQEARIRLAFDADGKWLAAEVDHLNNIGSYSTGGDASGLAMIMFPGPYHLPNYRYRTRSLYSNTPGQAAYRGPWMMESLARETMLEKAARQIGIDPIELRRRNLVTSGDLPHPLSKGFVLDRITPRETLDKVVQHIDVPRFRALQARAREEGRYLGLGFATYVEPTTFALFGGNFASEGAQVQIEPNGKVHAVMSTHSQGHGTQTTMAQVVADQLGVDLADVTVLDGDSHVGGYAAGASGSRQAVAGGGAALVAARRLSEKIKAIAAHLLNATPETIAIERGQVHVKGVADMTTSLAAIAAIAYFQPDRLPVGMEPGLSATSRYRPPPVVFSNATHACIVEVDAETGQVEILRWVACEDCGRQINPAIVEGQVAGGLAQAIGGVLLEEISYDAAGNPTAVTFKDYLLPTIHDVPKIEFLHLETLSHSEGGFKGVGEGGAIVGPPTLVNAIADALAPFRADCLNLPLSPPRLLAAMSRQDKDG